VNQLELINEVFSLVIAGDDGIPSEDLMEHAMKQGWILKLSEAFSISHFKERSPMNDAQKSLLKDIQNQILRGYLRDSLPDQAAIWKKEMRLKRWDAATMWATFLMDCPEFQEKTDLLREVKQLVGNLHTQLDQSSKALGYNLPRLPITEDREECLDQAATWMHEVIEATGMEDPMDYMTEINGTPEERVVLMLEMALGAVSLPRGD